MRIAIIAESFLPNVNGVSNSVRYILRHLQDHGHHALVIAPGARDGQPEISEYCGARIVRVPTVQFPLINSLPIGVPLATLRETLAEFQPDIIHLASPFFLAGAGAFAAQAMGIPAVAVFQTEIAGYTDRYHLKFLRRATWCWTRAMHNRCARTLVPSTAVHEQLAAHGVRQLYRWGRGVDTQMFRPEARSQQLRDAWRGDTDAIIVGYVGRLASEKAVHRLAPLDADPDYQTVVIGDGPKRAQLEQQLPNTIFLGVQLGEALAQAYASMDIFVHTGEFETFCQTIQEAHASGVPCIAPAVGGPLDLIQHNKDGMLLPLESFEDDLPVAVHKLWQLQCSQPLEQRPGDIGHQKVQRRTWEAICQELLGHYQAVCAQNNARRRALDRLLHRG